MSYLQFKSNYTNILTNNRFNRDIGEIIMKCQLYKMYKVLWVLFFSFTLITVGYAQDKPEEKTRIDIQNLFTPSGWMGDGEYGRKYIVFEGANKTDPHSKPSCIEIKYTFGPQMWAGIYWQNEPDNWGDQPGNNYSKENLIKVTFWARGTTGNEVVEFKSGGIKNNGKPYHDTLTRTTGRITLSKNWQQYTISLKDADLSSIIGGFCWVASKGYNNSSDITFYLDDIQFE